MNTTIAYLLALVLAAWAAYRLGGAAIGVLSPGSAAATKARFKKLLTKIVVIGAAALFTIGLTTQYLGPSIINAIISTSNWIAQGAQNTSNTASNATDTVADNAPQIGLWTLVLAYTAAAMWWIFRTPDKQHQRIRLILAVGLYIIILLGVKGMTYTA